MLAIIPKSYLTQGLNRVETNLKWQINQKIISMKIIKILMWLTTTKLTFRSIKKYPIVKIIKI
jgi:hypothetical protein